MPILSCDPAYSQLLDTNQELRDELQDGISINKSNEKKIRSLVKELEQCYRTISLQDNTIIAHEKEIEKLKSEISDLRKQLRVLQQDKKFKDEVGSIQDGQIIEFENKVEHLKARIWILTNKKISINALDMATTNLIVDVCRELDLLELHIGGGRLLANSIQNINGIRGMLNTVRATLQNISAERDQYQNLLNNENRLVRDLRNEIRDTRNQFLRSERLLEESRDQIQRITQMYTNALNDEREARRHNWQLAQNRQAALDNAQRERDEHRRNAHRMTVRYNNDTERWRKRHAGCAQQARNWKGQYRNSQNQVQVRNQNIFNLQQQIFALHNNLPQAQHMADARRLPVD